MRARGQAIADSILERLLTASLGRDVGGEVGADLPEPFGALRLVSLDSGDDDDDAILWAAAESTRPRSVG